MEATKKQFLCKLCHLKFTTKSYLEKHINTIHDGKKPYTCSVCSKSFSRKFHLKTHIDCIHAVSYTHLTLPTIYSV